MAVTDKGFGAYDVRGVYPDEVNEELAYRVGRSFPTLFQAKSVAIGHDIRLSGPSLRDALAKGLTEAGCNVVDIGQCGTEMIYFTTAHLGLDGGNVVVLLSPHEILRVLKSCSIVRDLAAEPGAPAQIAPDRLLQRKAGGAHLHRGPGGSHRRFPGGVNAPGLGVEAQGPLRHGVNDDATGDSPALPQILLVIAKALVAPYGDEAHGRCPWGRVQCIQPLSDGHLVEVIRAVGVLQV